MVALAIPLVLWLLLMSWLDQAFGPGPLISDPRACGHTEVDLTQVTDHFYLNLPPAGDLHFIAHRHPLFGEHWLQSTFTTTPSGLTAFLADSQLNTLGDPVDGYLVAPWTPDPDEPCLATFDAHHATRIAHYHDEGAAAGSKSLQRDVYVDTTDPSRPRIYIMATDI